mgnify:CR=1 FL=1
MLKNLRPINLENINNSNIYLDEENEKLYIEIDYMKEDRESKSGKSMLITSTNGNQRIAIFGFQDVYLNLNLYKFING